MKTIEEARKCWCPFGRAPINGDSVAMNLSINYGNKGEITPWTMCIADQCMMWRDGRSFADSQDEDGTELYVRQDAGYCGLAGKPQS